jgi:hypothetical protein
VFLRLLERVIVFLVHTENGYVAPGSSVDTTGAYSLIPARNYITAAKLAWHFECSTSFIRCTNTCTIALAYYVVLRHVFFRMKNASQYYLTEQGRERILGQAEKIGIHRDDLATNLGLKRRQCIYILSGQRPLSPNVRGKLRDVFKLTVDDLNSLMRIDASAAKKLTPKEEETRRAESARQLVAYTVAMCSRDWKNLICDPEVSARLTEGIDFPTFAQTVSASLSYAVAGEKEKDSAVFKDFPSNHFFQVSAVITLKWPEQEKEVVICYPRNSLPFQYGVPDGRAIVWSAAFLFRAYHRFPGFVTPMDRWLTAVQERHSNVENMLITGPDAVLRRLLAYKINLEPYQDVEIKPLGIMTRTKKKRIYTHYLFRCAISLVSKPVDLSVELNAIQTNGIPLSAVNGDESPEEVLVTQKGQPLPVELLTWKALFSNKPKLSNNDRADHVVFSRGFSLF